MCLAKFTCRPSARAADFDSDDNAQFSSLAQTLQRTTSCSVQTSIYMINSLRCCCSSFYHLIIIHVHTSWLVCQLHFTLEAELASFRKSAKYEDLLQCYVFQPIAMETLGSMDSLNAAFFTYLSCKISSVSGDACEASFFLFQCVSITIQCFNSVLFRESFISSDNTED